MNSFKKLIFTFLSIFLIAGIAKATNVTFATGAYIINMGVVPQTQANALKPYGLVYDLLKNYKVPVYWVISQSKAKDGTDFTYGGTDYKGGTFIIPAEFMSATVIARVTFFGVTKTVTTSSLTVDYTYKLTSAPKWTLDAQNGGIAASWFPLAGVPAAAYNWKTPATLGGCDDIFVMPHADPIWATHGNLYNWNRTYFGSIWAGCHAVSVLENMNNGTNQTNFLANNVGSIGNALNLWTAHAGATVPYTHQNPTHVGAQYMGITDNAHLNGSEQVYLPKTGGGWRATTKIIAYDPTQSNVPALSGGPAGIILMGRGFGLNSAGWVMYEAGHDISKLGVGSGSQSITAMRAFWDFSLISSVDKVPAVSAATVPSPIQINTDNAVSITASSPVGLTLTYLWTATLNGVATGSFASATSATTTFRTATAGNYIITYTITDACGRVTFVSTPVTVSSLPPSPTVVADALTLDPGCTGSPTGSVNVLSNDTDPLGGTLTITGIDTTSTPRRGSITSWTSAGVINYTANLSRSGPGTQTINYTATNANGNTTGTLTITVGTGSAPSAVADFYTGSVTQEDSIMRLTVLSNDGSGLTVQAITSYPTKGKVSINLNNQITYIPDADQTGTDQFIYRAANAAGNTDTAIVKLNITNNLCDGNKLMRTHPHDTTLRAGNDTYLREDKADKNYGAMDNIQVDGESDKPLRGMLKFSNLTLIPSAAVINSGTLRLVGTGTWITGNRGVAAYKMTRNWSEGTGTDDDGDPSWNEYSSGNDWTNAGGDFDSSSKVKIVVSTIGTYNWTITSYTSAWHTTSSTNYGLMLKFTDETSSNANQAKFFGSDENSTSGNRPGLIVNYHTCENIPVRSPLANPDDTTLVNGSSITLDVKTNDFCPATGTRSYSLKTTAHNGNSASINSSGIITYTASGTFNGVDTFLYVITNTVSATPYTDTARVYFTITNAPIVAVNDAPASANSGVTQTVTVTGNDSDPEGTIGANTHVVSISVQPVHGTASVNGSKQIVYVPTTGYSGTDVLTYSLCEPTAGCVTGVCSTATVTFTVTNQPPPTPGTSNVDVNLCTPKTINLIALVTDPEGSPLTLSALSALSDPTKGTLVDNNDGTVTFTPTVGAATGTAVATFTFSLTDGVNTVNGTVSLDFLDPTPTNAAPNAIKDNPESFTMNTVLYYEVRGNDTDPEGQDLSVPTIFTNPANGTVTVEASGLIKYTPTNNYVGADVFRYQIFDRIANSSTCAISNGLSDTADVRIVVSAAPIQLSGNVYNDLNALIGSPTNTIDGTGIGSLSSTPLYVYYYLNGTTTILGAAQVNEDGTFLFNNVTGSATYDFRISTTLADVGATVPSVALPTDWVNTGEFDASGAGNDGTANGILPSVAVTTTSISTLKFGVEQRPTSSTITAVSQTLPAGTTEATVPSTTFGGTDPSTGGAVASIRITSFPTNTTTLRIGGTPGSGGATYTSGTFPAEGLLIPTNSAGEPSTAIHVDPSLAGAGNVVFTYRTRDTARFESSATGAATQPFTTAAVVSLTGRVFNDLDGNSNNINNLSGLGNPAGATLYANLVDNGGIVIQVVTVAPNGVYSFTDISGLTNAATYTVRLSTNQGTVSLAAPAIALPDGWVNTGDNGTGTGDGTPNGSLSFTFATGTSVTDANFGIEKVAIPNTETATSALNPGGTTQSTVASTLFGASDESTGTISSITITSFPTNATTIVINGTSYTSGTWPGTVNVPTNSSGEPTQSITIDPISGSTSVAITYTATDNAGKVSTLSGTANIPFHTYGISGTVYDDADGLTDNTVDGEGLGNPESQTLYANLLNTAGTTVVATVTVNANGTYNFPIVDPGTFRVQISTVQGVVNDPTPATTLPTNWVPTGENSGISPGSDGTVNGIMASITIADGSVGDVNFGIDKTPASFNKTWTNLDPANFLTSSGDATYTLKVGLSATSGNSDGVVSSSDAANMPGKISASDFEDGLFAGSTGGTTGTAVFTVLPDDDNSMLVYNGVKLVAGGGSSNYWNSVTSRYEITDFNNSLLEMYFKGGTSSFGFTYGFKDAAGMLGTLGTYSATGSAPLPVKLLNFDVVKLNTEVLAKWATASEINNSHFDVQRSADTKNWLTVGTINGNGTTNSTIYYSFVDTKPLNGINYYRLKQVDFNGAYEYSNIRWVSFDKVGTNNVSVYPNPTSGIVTVSMTNQNYFEDVNISVSDMTGRLVLANTYANASNNKFEETINLKDFEKGFYQITISNSSYTKTVKVLKF